MAGTKNQEDFELLKQMILWARSERIVLSHVSFGEIGLQLTDLRVNAIETDRKPPDVRTLEEQWADQLGVTLPEGPGYE